MYSWRREKIEFSKSTLFNCLSFSKLISLLEILSQNVQTQQSWIQLQFSQVFSVFFSLRIETGWSTKRNKDEFNHNYFLSFIQGSRAHRKISETDDISPKVDSSLWSLFQIFSFRIKLEFILLTCIFLRELLKENVFNNKTETKFTRYLLDFLIFKIIRNQMKFDPFLSLSCCFFAIQKSKSSASFLLISLLFKEMKKSSDGINIFRFSFFDRESVWLFSTKIKSIHSQSLNSKKRETRNLCENRNEIQFSCLKIFDFWIKNFVRWKEEKTELSSTGELQFLE
jgi:hypothetical protein